MTTTTNNEQKKLNVPNLRFKEFQGEWEKCRLGDVCTFLSGGTPKIDVKEFWNGTIPFVSAISMHDTYILDSKSHISEEGLKHGSRLLTKNNLLLLVRGSMLWNTIPICLNKNDVAFNQDVKGIIANDTINNEFLLYWLKSKEQRLKYMVTGTGLGAGKLDTSDLLSMIVYIPAMKEQDKVARLLSLFDERIATQSKIIEDLKKLKSAISKHLFSRKDLLETTIRLADIAALKNGYAFQSSKYDTKGKWKILTIANVSGERYINDDDCNCIINLPNDIQGHQVLKEGDILISLTGNVGRVSLCKAGNILLNQRVGLLCITKNVNQEFLYQVLSSRRFENSMVACGQGAAQMNIGKGDVENFVLPYSSNANNIHLVARILHSYDECIINEQQELTLLTMQKQYLLDQMFI